MRIQTAGNVMSQGALYLSLSLLKTKNTLSISISLSQTHSRTHTHKKNLPLGGKTGNLRLLIPTRENRADMDDGPSVCKINSPL